MPNLKQDHQIRLILASASPRRLDLLGQIQIFPDQIIPANIDETPHRTELPAGYASRMAFEKAEYVAGALAAENVGKNGHSATYVLAGDTVVAAGRRILPKAETAQQARDCLLILSGRRHRVYGGIALHLPNGSVRRRLVHSYVRFRCRSALDIDQYIDSGDWQGKAGGYAIQGPAARFIRDIAGSYSNIVGFSLYDIAMIFDAVGWYDWAYFSGGTKVAQSKQKKRS